MRKRAAGSAAAAPLVGEENLGAVVVKGRRVPVGEPGVYHFVDSHRVFRIGDIDQDAVAGAGTRCKSNLGVRGDVVTLVGHSRQLRTWAMITAAPQTRDLTGVWITEEERSADHTGLGRVC